MKSNIYFKFMSYKDFETLQFDGLTISVADLKEEIIQKKNLGKKENYDLVLSNSQTGEEYKADALIYKNTSVNVARIPVTRQVKREARKDIASFPQQLDETPSIESITKASNIAALDVSEEEKIKIMVEQSNAEFNHINYTRTAKTVPMGVVPRNYVCHKCGQPGHFIQTCPKLREIANLDNYPRLKRSTGIPNSFMKKVDDINTPGVLVTSTGELVVPTIDAEAYKIGKKERPPFVEDTGSDKGDLEEDKMVPKELLCPICHSILNDAVVAPCCGDSACDDCLRSAILKSTTLTCPMCKVDNVSCDGLIANKFIRTAVINYQNEVGYTTAKPVVTSAASSNVIITNTVLNAVSSVNHLSVLNQQQLQPKQPYVYLTTQQLFYQQPEQVLYSQQAQNDDLNKPAILQASSSSTLNDLSATTKSTPFDWSKSRLGEVMSVPGVPGAKMVKVMVPKNQASVTSSYPIVPHALNYPPPPLMQPINNPVMMYQPPGNHLVVPQPIMQPPPTLSTNYHAQVPGAPSYPRHDALRPTTSSIPPTSSHLPLSEEEFYREKKRLHLIETNKRKDGYISSDSSIPQNSNQLMEVPSRQKDLFEFAADIMYHKTANKAKSPHSWSSAGSRRRSRSISGGRYSSSSSASYASYKRSLSRSHSRKRSTLVDRHRYHSSSRKLSRRLSRSHNRMRNRSVRSRERMISNERGRIRSRGRSKLDSRERSRIRSRGRSREKRRSSKQMMRSLRSNSRTYRFHRHGSRSSSYGSSSPSITYDRRGHRGSSYSSPWRPPPHHPVDFPPFPDPFRPHPPFGHSLNMQPRMPPPLAPRYEGSPGRRHMPPFHMPLVINPLHPPPFPRNDFSSKELPADRPWDMDYKSGNVWYSRRSHTPRRSRSNERRRDERMNGRIDDRRIDKQNDRKIDRMSRRIDERRNERLDARRSDRLDERREERIHERSHYDSRDRTGVNSRSRRKKSRSNDRRRKDTSRERRKESSRERNRCMEERWFSRSTDRRDEDRGEERKNETNKDDNRRHNRNETNSKKIDKSVDKTTSNHTTKQVDLPSNKQLIKQTGQNTIKPIQKVLDAKPPKSMVVKPNDEKKKEENKNQNDDNAKKKNNLKEGNKANNKTDPKIEQDSFKLTNSLEDRKRKSGNGTEQISKEKYDKRKKIDESSKKDDKHIMEKEDRGKVEKKRKLSLHQVEGEEKFEPDYNEGNEKEGDLKTDKTDAKANEEKSSRHKKKHKKEKKKHSKKH